MSAAKPLLPKGVPTFNELLSAAPNFSGCFLRLEASSLGSWVSAKHNCKKCLEWAKWPFTEEIASTVGSQFCWLTAWVPWDYLALWICNCPGRHWNWQCDCPGRRWKVQIKAQQIGEVQYSTYFAYYADPLVKHFWPKKLCIMCLIPLLHFFLICLILLLHFFVMFRILRVHLRLMFLLQLMHLWYIKMFFLDQVKRFNPNCAAFLTMPARSISLCFSSSFLFASSYLTMPSSYFVIFSFICLIVSRISCLIILTYWNSACLLIVSSSNIIYCAWFVGIGVGVGQLPNKPKPATSAITPMSSPTKARLPGEEASSSKHSAATAIKCRQGREDMTGEWRIKSFLAWELPVLEPNSDLPNTQNTHLPMGLWGINGDPAAHQRRTAIQLCHTISQLWESCTLRED